MKDFKFIYEGEKMPDSPVIYDLCKEDTLLMYDEKENKWMRCMTAAYCEQLVLDVAGPVSLFRPYMETKDWMQIKGWGIPHEMYLKALLKSHKVARFFRKHKLLEE